MNEVETPKKPLIYYYCVVVLVLMLFNLLAMPWLAQRRIVEVDYGTFISMVENGQVGRAEIQEQENRILFLFKTKVSPALKQGHGPDLGSARYFS